MIKKIICRQMLIIWYFQSEEDKQLQEELNSLVERLQENAESAPQSLEQIKSLIRSSTTSMTSVPKPLKFMRPHYQTMKVHTFLIIFLLPFLLMCFIFTQDIYEKFASSDPSKKFCADIVSVLAMTMSEERECLKYRLLGKREEVGDWGHEYVR